MQYGICIKFIIYSKKDGFLVLHFFGRQISWDVMEEGDFFYIVPISHTPVTPSIIYLSEKIYISNLLINFSEVILIKK